MVMSSGVCGDGGRDDYSLDAETALGIHDISLLNCCLQAYTSVSKAGLVLRDHQDLGKHMNTVVFHTKMVDYLDEMINECGDLAVYWSVVYLSLLDL